MSKVYNDHAIIVQLLNSDALGKIKTWLPKFEAAMFLLLAEISAQLTSNLYARVRCKHTHGIRE